MKTARKTTRCRSAMLILCLAAGYLPSLVNGQITPISSPSGFAFTANLITFAGLAPFAEPTNVDGVGFILQNGQGPDVAYDPSPPREYGPNEGTIIQNIASGFSDLNLYFPAEIYQCGFEMRTWPSETINLSFYESGSLLETLAVPTRTTTSDPNSPLLFYGFQSTTPFDHLFIAVRGPNTDFFAMDNLRYTVVPEPSALITLGAGLVACIAVRRGRR